ncbi:MAG: beta-galactosidase [Patescibacteria group bacterium]|nr:beta-galactosidase [Patescibacteria group bacterium]
MIVLIIILALLLIGVVIHFCTQKRNTAQIYGTNFNDEYAAFLGLDPHQTFATLLDDWGFRYIRLAVQWDVVEAQRGIYNFSELNWYMDEAAKRGAKITLVVGQKIPRWPECHPPKWAASLSDAEYRAAIKQLIKKSVEQYKDHPALEIWQVENEPYLAFGICRKFDKKMLESEIAMVRSIDSGHKILITDSGELSMWWKTARAGDYFGTTLYRNVWNESLGYFSYSWLSPMFYRAKLFLTGQKTANTFIAELQAEPWVPDYDIKALALSEQYKTMTPSNFKANVDYAQRVGFPRAYLWGAEWWYWMKEVKGVSDFVDFAKTLKKE